MAKIPCPPGYRLIKWLGDPPILKKDGFSVANWKYENRRVIRVPGQSARIINKRDDPRLTRSYCWEADNFSGIIPVEAGDAQVILERQPHEFRDVTDEENPYTVEHSPIIIPY